MSVRRGKRPDFAGQNWVLGKNVVKKIRRRAFFHCIYLANCV